MAAAASRNSGKIVFIDPDPTPVEDGEEGPSQYRVWLASPAPQLADESDSASLTRCDRTLDKHQNLAAKAARRLTQALGLPTELSAAIIEAARQHDEGKAEVRWQRALGNPDPTAPLAKSSHQHFDIRLNDGYRHELGSLRGQHFSPLTAHLIAAHHGWARPLFTEKALRKSGCREPGEAAPGRFADLQTRYGWWGLAYLEAVVRCADVLAEVLIAALETDPGCD
jgi:CRISPR-associated endonuclease/helicase Cas3